jgi:hypothetical protein
MLAHDCPDNIESYVAVAMDQAMPHAGNVAPGDLGICGLGLGGDFACRLAENLQRPNDSVLMQAARNKGCFVEPFNKASRVPRSQQQRRVARGQSVIYRFGLGQDRAAADEVAARIDRLALDEVDRAPEQALQRLF